MIPYKFCQNGLRSERLVPSEVEGGLWGEELIPACEYDRCLMDEGGGLTTGRLGHLGMEEGRRVWDLCVCVCVCLCVCVCVCACLHVSMCEELRWHESDYTSNKHTLLYNTTCVLIAMVCSDGSNSQQWEWTGRALPVSCNKQSQSWKGPLISLWNPLPKISWRVEKNTCTYCS